jgi:membrane-bound metal-dependent hydrolase YbcI (DUF457 family)
MFIGHFAVGFTAKRFAPRTSMATLVAAPLFLDVLWPVFLLLGWERVRIDPGNTAFTPLDFVSYPWSHSLVMSILWATIFAFVYYRIAHYRAGAAAIWIAVTSHWVLDWITHRPDMPIYPGSARFGLGLWNSIPGTITVELVMLAAGVLLYLGATRARDRIGQYAFIGYIAILLFLYLGTGVGEPPPSVSAIIWAGIIASIILITWAGWFDAHRMLSRTSEDRERRSASNSY